MSIISLTDVTKRYPGSIKAALDNVSLSVHQGEKIALLGSNGAGKSTLINCIFGITPIDKGLIRVNDAVVTGKNLSFRRSLGLMPSFDTLIGEFTLNEYIQFVFKYHSLNQRAFEQVIDSLLSTFKLSDKLNNCLNKFSKGERAKVQIIASLVHDPQCVIMDEPFSNLDIVSRQDLVNYINSQKNKTWIISSHDLDLSLEFCNRVVIITNGKVTKDIAITEDISSSSKLSIIEHMRL